MRFADLEAVTLDAFGTLVTLVDPLPALERALWEVGVSRSRGEIAAAFAAEAAYYRPRSLEGRDPETLADLQRRCAAGFLAALGAAPERTIHVGAGPSAELGAAAAGIHFAPAPLADAVAAWS